MRQPMLNSKTTKIGTKQQLMAVCVLGLIDLLPVSSASLGTVPHFIPYLRPLLSPGKRSPAYWAGLCWQIGFLHPLDTHAQKRSHFTMGIEQFNQVTRPHMP
jgi:hypothetical protein